MDENVATLRARLPESKSENATEVLKVRKSQESKEKKVSINTTVHTYILAVSPIREVADNKKNKKGVTIFAH